MPQMYPNLHFVSTLFFSPSSWFGCAQIEIHETPYIDTWIEKIYTNWYHIFHIDIDTFATCEWIFEI
jgi:hypothetical protein